MPSTGKLVAFVSLWLGILNGTLPVEVLAPPATARVELLLDGRPAGALAGPPWTGTLDVGPEIAPHEVIAVARDAAGEELGRARQWLNLPQPPAILDVTLQVTPEKGGVARVAWAAVEGVAPREVRATLDGAPLAVRDPAAIALPAYDPDSPHLLRVEAAFPGDLTASRELVFGGALAEETSTELTAVPVLLAGRRPAGEIAVMASGRRLAPFAVEEGDADLVVVFDPGARAALRGMIGELLRRAPGVTRAPTASSWVDGRHVARLPPQTRLRVIWPVARQPARPELRWEVFPYTPELSRWEGGLLWHLLLSDGPPAAGGDPALADAVALAGRMAAQNARRRAVLLVVAPGGRDPSHFSAGAVRRYLERLRVPLRVWAPGKVDPAAAAAWGEVEPLPHLAGFERAAKRLFEHLERQRIVWVAGAHLPQELTLAPEARGVVPIATLDSDTPRLRD